MMKNKLKLIIALTLIMFILWNRLFRERLPKNLFDLNKTWLHIIIIIIIITFFLFLLINVMCSLLNVNDYVYLTPYSYTSRFLNLIEEYILNSPKYLLTALSFKIDIKNIIEKPISYLTVYFYYPKILNFSLDFIPTIIVSSVFFLDIYYFHQITYFYKIIILLLIPLLFRVSTFIVDDVCDSNITYINHHIYFERDNDDFIAHPVQTTPKIPNALTKDEIQKYFEWLCDQWDIYTTIKNFCNSITDVRDYYKGYVQLYNYILYFFGWNYYLYFLILNLN